MKGSLVSQDQGRGGGREVSGEAALQENLLEREEAEEYPPG